MKICVAASQLNIYSETFIRQHIERLPFEVVTLSGPNFDQALGRRLLQKSLPERLTSFALRKMGRYDQRKFAVQRQADWLRQEGVKAVLAEYGLTGISLLEPCARAKVPLIVHFHGFDAHDEPTVAPRREEYRRLFAQAVAIIGVSHAMCLRLQELGAPPEKIHYVPSYVDPAHFPPVSTEKAPPTFLAVGRFVEKKAPHLTLLAFAKVLAVCPDARLEMAGEGPLEGACRWLARALGIEHAVIFHGRKDHAWVAVAMGRVRAFVQHSVRAESGDSEGTPVAILEAQCSGLPVVATAHTGIADVVADGETGFLCREGDCEGMAQSMIRLCEASPETIQTMGRAARNRFLTEFSREKTLDKLAAVIRDSIRC